MSTTNPSQSEGIAARPARTLTPSRGGGFSQIVSVGSYRPARVVTNDEICQVLDSSDQWIRERTGIVTRYFAEPEQSVVDLAEPAARAALDRAGLAPGDIDAIMVATVSHLQQMPSAATLLAHRLGATPAAALDVAAACAGFCHAISLADGLIRAGTAANVLVVGTEKLTDLISPTDRSTAFIFGDGAGAAVVSAVGDHGEPGIGPTIWGSDGSRWEHITSDSYASIRRHLVAGLPAIPPPAPPRFDIGSDVSAEIAAELNAAAQLNSAAEPNSAPELNSAAELNSGEAGQAGQDVLPIWPTLRMQGQAVFRWAVWEMAPIARKALDAAGVAPGDLAAFIPHQANVRIIDSLAKQIGLPASVVIARDIVEAGNTSAASIPMAMDTLLERQPELSGGLALLIGFGAGLSYAAQVVRLP